MIYRIFADIVVIFHLAFIVFAVIGGILILRWKSIVWLHLPATIWAVLILLVGWVCPLTPLENFLRQKGGERGYETSFIDQYIIPVIYPGELSSSVEFLLAMVLALVNCSIYGWFLLWKKCPKNNYEV